MSGFQDIGSGTGDMRSGNFTFIQVANKSICGGIKDLADHIEHPGKKRPFHRKNLVGATRLVR